tara:strand:- start:1544 stop:2272 length:729 start_codon:yes stop_codon:yes gene_type:complete
MAWIKSDETLSQHPKVDLLSNLLEIHPAQAIGHLHYLWWWCLNYAETGDLTRYKNMIAKASRFDGDNDKYVNALVETGWLDQQEKSLIVHDWEDYHGALLEQRTKNKERQRAYRTQKSEITKVNKELDASDLAEMFKAMCEVVYGKSYEELKQSLAKDERGRINNAIKQIQDAGGNADDIHTRGLNYFIKYGERPTPQALSGGWNRYAEIITDQDRQKNIKRVGHYKSHNELQEWAKEVDNS